MPMRISDFIEASNAETTPEGVFALYERAAAELGFDRLMYSALTDHPYYDAVTSPAVMRNYPDDWVAHYVEQGYVVTDPVRSHCLRQRRAFTWKDMMAKRKLARGERAVMVEGDAAGLHDGIAVPLHGPEGEVMGVGMASSGTGADAEAHLARIELITRQFHNVYTELALPHVAASRPVPTLTPREREVLQWAAAGKSNSVIADLLKVSDHAVDFHMRNILVKLDADTRVTAVVKGLRWNLIRM